MRRLWFLWLVLLVVPAQAQEDTPPTHNPFGIVEGAWQAELACDLNLGWERLIFDWSAHQPNGPDEFVGFLNIPDEWLTGATACGREVVAVVKQVPAWATDGLPGAGVPRGLYLPVDDPDNLWANFMRQTAAYYAPRGVTRFIILNEPDIAPGTYGFEFEGSLEDYFMMVKVAAIAAREGNPAARIHLAGTTYWHDINSGERLYTDRLLERIATDPDAPQYDYYFDALSLHIYFRTDTVYDIVRVYQRLLAQHGFGDKVIWITETNASPNLDPNWPVTRPQFQITLDQQAAFIAQAIAQSFAAGVQRISVYKLYDQSLPEGGESFGIVIPGSAQPRPAFTTYQFLTDTLQNVISAQLARNTRVNAVELRHSDERQTLMAWARTENTTMLEVGATSDKAYLMDQYGDRRILRPQDGIYTLTLPAATCEDGDEGCVVGGNVWLLVQPIGDAPLTEVTPNNRYPLILGDVETVAPQSS